MSFAAVGSLQNGENAVTGTSTTFPLTTTTVGDFILASLANNTTWTTAVSSGNVTWTQLYPASGGINFTAAGLNPFYINHWIGKVTATGADTITVTYNTSMGGANSRFDAHEFSSTSGNAYLEVAGKVDSTGTSNWATLTPNGPGRLYWGWCEDTGSANSTGSTPASFVPQPDVNGNGAGYCLNVSAAYTPVWGDSTMVAGIMVLMSETLPGSLSMLEQLPPIYQQRIS